MVLSSSSGLLIINRLCPHSSRIQKRDRITYSVLLQIFTNSYNIHMRWRLDHLNSHQIHFDKLTG